nr:hypothetical protein [uncultured Allomuricauda sp.]
MLRKNYLWIAFLLSIFVCPAQKVKIKKGDILVDNVKIGHVDKVKVKNDSLNETFYKVTDNSAEHIFNFRNEFIESPLYFEDKRYFFHTMEYVKEQKWAAVENPKFYPSEKQVAKYLVSHDLLDKEGINDAAISKFTRNKGVLPSSIQKLIKEEEELATYARYKVDRLLTDPIFVFFDKTTAATSAVSNALVTKSRYTIYQGIKDPKTNDFISKTLIGYAIAEEIITSEKIGWSTNPPIDYRPNPKSGYRLFVYNTKHVPMASFRFITYKTYHPYGNFGPMQSNLRDINSLEGRIEYIASDLIDKGVL